MSHAKARTRRPQHIKSDAAFGRLFTAALLSWVVYALLDHWTPATDQVAMWCAGLVAGVVAAASPRRSRRR